MTQYITISEASQLLDKSAQTIRRLVKLNKLRYKRIRTAQGFNYEIERASVFQLLDHRDESSKSFKAKENSVVHEISLENHVNRQVYEFADPQSSFSMTARRKKDPVSRAKEPKRLGQTGLIDLPEENILVEEKGNISQVGFENTSDDHESLSKDSAKAVAQTSQTPVQKTTQQSAQASDNTQQMFFQQFNETIRGLIEQHASILKVYEEDKRNLFGLAEKFQERIINLESYIKQLEAPKKKWYEFWK